MGNKIWFNNDADDDIRDIIDDYDVNDVDVV